MPLTAKGEKIKANMEAEYGKERGERVFYASKNAGKISGVDSMDVMTKVADGVGKLVERFDSFLVRRRAGFKTRHDADPNDDISNLKGRLERAIESKDADKLKSILESMRRGNIGERVAGVKELCTKARAVIAGK